MLGKGKKEKQRTAQIISGEDLATFKVKETWDKRDPRSCLNLMPLDMLLIFMDNRKEIESKIRTNVDRKRPISLVCALRSSFWREYERAQVFGLDKMDRENIYSGICNSIQFSEILKNVDNVSWILTTPTAHIIQLEEAFNKAVGVMEEILDFPLYDETEHESEDAEGNKVTKVTRKPNLSNAKLMLEVYKMLEDRIKGPVIQRIEQKNLNHNITRQIRNAEEAPRNLSVIEMAEEKQKLLEEVGNIVSVTEVDADA